MCFLVIIVAMTHPTQLPVIQCSQDTAAQNVAMKEVMPEGRLFCLTLAANIVAGAGLLWNYGYRLQYEQIVGITTPQYR